MLVTATADDFGLVKLFKYPSPVEKNAACHEYRGHSSHVTNARFIKNSPYLITTGGEDKCIFQWKYTLDGAPVAATGKTPKPVDVSNIEDDLGGYAAAPKAGPGGTSKQMKKASPFGADEDGGFELEDAGEGDERMAVLPFKGQVERSVPTGWKNPPGGNQKPDGNLKIKYAHGFRSFDTRNNLKYISKDEIVFTTAALGVVHNKTSNTQRFFNMHGDDVVSLAINPKNREIVATGQMAQRGKAKKIDIFVWNTTTMQMLAQLNNFHLGAIRKLEFSPSGDKLLTIGEDP